MWRPSGAKNENSQKGTFNDIFAAADQREDQAEEGDASRRPLLCHTPDSIASADDGSHVAGPALTQRIPSAPDLSSGAGGLEMRHSASTSSILDMSSIDWRNSVHKPLTYRMGNSTIRLQRPLAAAILVVLGALLFLLYLILAGGGKRSHRGPYSRESDFLSHSPDLLLPTPEPYNRTYPLSRPTITEKGMRYSLAVIADLDEVRGSHYRFGNSPFGDLPPPLLGIYPFWDLSLWGGISLLLERSEIRASDIRS